MLRSFLRLFDLRLATRELWKVLGAQDIPHRWRWMVVSAIIPVSVFSWFYSQEYIAEPRPPKVIYVQNWRADRTDAEIIAGNIAAAQAKAAQQAMEDQRAEDMKQMYKAVGRATFIDVDKIERDAKAEQAAEEARGAAKAKAP